MSKTLIEHPESFLSHPLGDLFRIVVRSEESKFAGVRFRNFTNTEALSKLGPELGFSVGNLVPDMDFEPVVTLIPNIAPSNKIWVFW